MTQLLEKAWTEVCKLPEEDQDAIAAGILEELADERRWDESFARSQDLLAKMADEALQEHRAGLTKPLDADGGLVLDRASSGIRKDSGANVIGNS